jgi:cytidylate kinase
LATRLGFDFLDTGAMYRTVALALSRSAVPLSYTHPEPQFRELVESMQLTMDQGRVWLNGEDVTLLIRSPAVTQLTRVAADSPVVREYLCRQQRRFAEGKDLVTEGRDQGTVVFPDAACKFFLTASPEERARRRHAELLARGEEIACETILQAQNQRDADDRARAIAPLLPAPDALVIDTSGLTLDQVLERLCAAVEARRNG